jgi:hypothetical protein
MEELLEPQLLPASNSPSQPAKIKKPEKRTVVSDQEWVSLIVQLYRKIRPNLSLAICLGKYTDVNTLHKAYTGAVTLNPLYLNREQAIAADAESRYWIANIRHRRRLPELSESSRRMPGDWPRRPTCSCSPTGRRNFGHVRPARLTALIVSPKPVPGHLGSFTLRYRTAITFISSMPADDAH